ncbi:NAD(P)/FAD-dependent oxidoreductase [Sutcliffiella rhizosphaerae]|uniref:Cobalt-factor III methyltransferase n=1 Tax=Sutcliffiella rhizosphaerae TaxID=2880967 RepID=A0ABN8ADF6_9BACI|nr:nitrite reductase [Sutcliffiella rhizosphaerae]CAG9622041.1 Cobalt-factor III methyltransferase [Sutcliffiella rhizosphaerae]
MGEKMVKLAVNAGIGFGAKLNSQQLLTLARYLTEDNELEVTTFQQLYVDIPQSNINEVKDEFDKVGLHCYPVGNFVKSLRTCNFCKGELEEGMPVAKEINRRIAGRPVPFTLKPAYTGCPVACGEPLVNDIGIIKQGEAHFDLYVGGKAKGLDARTGRLIAGGLSEEKLYKTIDRLIDIYAAEGKKREQFAKFVNRYGFEALKGRLEA